MLERDARRDANLGPLLRRPDYFDGWFGAANVAEIAPSVTSAGTDAPRPDVPERRGRHARLDDCAPSVAVPTSPSGPRHAAPDVSSHAAPDVSRLAATMQFRARRPTPWYRRRAVLAGLSVLVLAVPVSVLLVLLRQPPPTPPPVEPIPVPVTTAATTAPLAPPAPPAPPPDPAGESPSPVLQSPPAPAPPDRHPAPATQRKPEIGVTRTPVTRTPFSAVPPTPPTTGHNSATPGDEPRHWGLW